MSTVLIKFQYRNNRRQTRLFHSLSISLQYLIKKLANGESAPAKPRNPSGLYVSALSIATWLLPVMAQQTTKKPRCEAAKRRSKEEKAEEYLTNEALAVSRWLMTTLRLLAALVATSAISVPKYEPRYAFIFSGYLLQHLFLIFFASYLYEKYHLSMSISV